MIDVDMRRPVLDCEPPPNVPSSDEIELAETLLHRLEARYLGRQESAGVPASAPG
ncbi:MAG: hypothetical protein IPN24_03330 [Betaproteobacteria bacterium]|nr:hypothetical protein [Betaproteobacteria bacterium]